MKKYLALVLMVVFLGGCSYLRWEALPPESEPKPAKPIVHNVKTQNLLPFYQSLTEQDKEIYDRIRVAIESHDTSEIIIGTYHSESELEAASDRTQQIYRYLVYEQPQYIWVDISRYEAKVWTWGEERKLGIQLSYLMDEEEAETKLAALNAKVDQIVQEAESREGIFAQVLYVHDAIVESTVYDNVLAKSDNTAVIGRSAYGCLVDGKTVCSGYALAFNMVMQKLGYECGVEIDVLQLESISSGHVWNYAKLEDEYYYFDLTWDDTIFDTEDYRQYLDYTHQYFAINKWENQHILSEHSIAPECTGTKYNYYIYNDWNVEQYDFEVVKRIILEQQDKKCIGMRFEDYRDILKAEQELFKDGRIYEILPAIQNAKYLISDSNCHLYLFYE